jgi:membrane protein
MAESPNQRAKKPRHSRLENRFKEFSRRLIEKCDDDEIFFMAGSIAFNLVLALFPLLILGIGLTGFVLARFGDPAEFVLSLVTGSLPDVAGTDLTVLVEQITQGLLARRTGYTVAGSVFLLWVATRLSGSLRVALRETFDVGVKRHPVKAKLFDVVAVLIGISLLTANLGVTVAIAATVDYSVYLFGMDGAPLSLAERALGILVSFASIWMLLFLVYRYMPARTVAIRTAVIAATFTAVSHETLKYGFSWYATEVANYSSTLGNLATGAVLFFWIYYESVVFILGGEVAQVSIMRKASRVGAVMFEDDA